MSNLGFSGMSIRRDPNQRVKIGKRLTPGDVHVDRLNTRFLHAYMQQASNFVAGRVFPVIPSDRQSNYYPQAAAAGLELPMASTVNMAQGYEHRRFKPP